MMLARILNLLVIQTLPELLAEGLRGRIYSCFIDSWLVTVTDEGMIKSEGGVTIITPNPGNNSRLEKNLKI